MTQMPLMELKTSHLLEKVGSGTHAPGSGSVAALMGVLACKLTTTVGKLTLSKAKYRNEHAAVQLLLEEIESELEPVLARLFQEDAEVFNKVILLRNERDAAKEAGNQKQERRASEQALSELRVATELQFRVAAACLRLVERGSVMFDIGFKSARGDSGAAVSAAIAGAMSSMFVINLNLRSFRDGAWAKAKRADVDELQKAIERAQLEAFGRLGALKATDIEAVQPALFEGDPPAAKPVDR